MQDEASCRNANECLLVKSSCYWYSLEKLLLNNIQTTPLKKQFTCPILHTHGSLDQLHLKGPPTPEHDGCP